MFRKLTGFRTLTRKSHNRPSNSPPVRLELEQLEERMLLSTIQWTNRGTSQADSDLFGATFGTNATAARAIVEQAILDWSRAIDNFHYRNVGQSNYASRDNTFNLAVFAGDLGPNQRGLNTFNRSDPDGKPIQASIFMDDNGGGRGWYFDPVPGDNSEFTGLVSRFQSTFTGAGAQNDDDDFYRTILHEMGHALGLNLGLPNFLEARGIDQVDGTSQLFLFSRNGVTASFTVATRGGGHLYEGPADPAFPADPIHPNELMNVGRTVNAPPTTRQLISDLDVRILSAAYGYTVILPSTTETFLANLNSTSGALTINGDPQTVNNTIKLSTVSSGQFLRVDVNGVISNWPKFAVKSIMINTGNGTDTINLQSSFPGVPIAVNSGDLDDIVQVASDLGAFVNLNGGLGANYLIIENSIRTSIADLAAGVLIVNTAGQNTVVPYTNFARLAVNGDSNDMVRVNATRPETPVSVIGVGTVRVPRLDIALGRVSVLGRGTTFLTITDATSSANEFRVNPDALVASIGGSNRTVDYSEIRTLTINGGSGGNLFTVTGTHAAPVVLNTGLGLDHTFVQASSGPVIINGQGGLDDVGIGLAGSVRNIGGPLTVENFGGYSAVNVVNDADAIARTAILSKNGSYHVINGLTPGGNIVVRGSQLRSLSIRTGNGGNTFQIHDTPTSNTPGGLTTTLNTGIGSDHVSVLGTSGGLIVNGQSGNDTVNVGLAGRVQSLAGALTITNVGSFSTVNVNNFSDKVARTMILYNNGTYNVISGLGSADIAMRGSELSALTIRLGDGGNTIRIHDTPAGIAPANLTTTLRTGRGNDQITVNGTTGGLALNALVGTNAITVGSAATGLDAINAPIYVSGPLGSNTLRVNDGVVTTGHQYVVDRDFVQRLDKARISYQDLASLRLDAGTGLDTVDVRRTLNPILIDGHGGGDTVNLGMDGDMGSLFGAPTIQNLGPSSQTLHLNNWADAAFQTVAMFLEPQSGFYVVKGLSPTNVRFKDVGALEVSMGDGGSNFTIDNISRSSLDASIITGNGNDTINVVRYRGNLTIDSQQGLNNIVLGGAQYGLANVRGLVTIVDGAGTESLTMIDTPNTTGRRFNITDTLTSITDTLDSTVTRDLAAYSGLVGYTLRAGAGNDVFKPESMPGFGGTLDGGGGTNTLDYSAYVGAASTLARAAQLDRDLGLYATDNLFENFYGHSERWVRDTSALWYFILPDGRIYRDDAGAAALPAASLVDTLDPSFHQDIVKLVNAQHLYAGSLDQDPFGPLAAQLDRDLNLNATDNLFYNYGGRNERWMVSGDYPTDFVWYFILPNGELYLWDRVPDSANGQLVATLDASFHDDISKLVDAQYLFNRDSSASLVARYSGEQNFNDAVGGNDGTQVGGVGFDPGKFGYAFSFDDNYVTVPNAPSLEPTTVSVEAWVNSWFTQPSNVYVLAKGGNGDLKSSYALYTGDSSGLVFSVYDGDYTNVESPESGVGIWDGNWHHIVGTYDGASVRLYVDGAEVGGGTPTNIAIAYGLQDTEDPSLGTDDLFIGTHPLIDGGANYIGLVDELSVYNRALSSAEIQAHFAGNPPTQSTGVVVNLQLGTATGLSGGIANIQNVIGSTGDDILVGNGGNVLSGGGGRDLLIAGAFASVLNGGNDDDILIGGTTNYDHDQTALQAIMAEWSSDSDYATRVANLSNGSNGAPQLNAATAHSNGGGNTLDGNAGLDYFFHNMDDLDTLYGDPLTEEFVAV